MGLDDSFLEVNVSAHVEVFVLTRSTVRMAVTPEIGMNTNPRLVACEVVGVGAGQAGLPWLRARVPAVMGVIVRLGWNVF